ncbi:molybdenum cofactor guanylyltransferase MobA [Pseudoruegeria sp. SHC-113]|uniref:molybdenum cofactor guanylyltransferase MobA n=1 Tax=Pseudoruegeria sp. SHC-113 TaxID=2855439 RepID=UPI0021BA8465|nr:molybdenum cofactor guanylyltransferase MobA [Pseudoruegeria sp. SHC-113]MCT8158931.1 molybdenum cofactor guanylyltransferase MobA [Pseudoruegeria sp. SHC-113]
MREPYGVILAGGRATRMGGGDKGLLQIAGQSLLARVVDRIAPQVAGLALNANGDAARFAGFGLPVLPDGIAEYPGPLAGVLAGMDWAAAQGADHVVSVAADTPFFPEDLVPRLLLAAETEAKPIALAATPRPDGGHWRHPTFGLWPVALRHDLRAALEGGLRKVVLWTDSHGTATAPFPATPFDPFFNVNTPEDLETARRMAEGARA